VPTISIQPKQIVGTALSRLCPPYQTAVSGTQTTNSLIPLRFILP